MRLLKTINPKITKSKFNADFKKIYEFGLAKADLARLIELATK